MIFLGADHRGLEMKGRIAKWLAGREYNFEDVGAYEVDRNDDYVDFAIALAQKIAENSDKHMGILICGSGVGMEIAANKVKGVRCGLGFAVDQVNAARKDDNINVLALAADNLTDEEALGLVEMFLTTPFDTSEKYLRRIEKLKRFESTSFEAHE